VKKKRKVEMSEAVQKLDMLRTTVRLAMLSKEGGDGAKAFELAKHYPGLRELIKQAILERAPWELAYHEVNMRLMDALTANPPRRIPG
jgi:hypothetical protein